MDWVLKGVVDQVIVSASTIRAQMLRQAKQKLEYTSLKGRKEGMGVDLAHSRMIYNIVPGTVNASAFPPYYGSPSDETAWFEVATPCGYNQSSVSLWECFSFLTLLVPMLVKKIGEHDSK